MSITCPTGQYVNTSGATACTLCAPGTYNNRTGAVAAAACANGSTWLFRNSTTGYYYVNLFYNASIPPYVNEALDYATPWINQIGAPSASQYLFQDIASTYTRFSKVRIQQLVVVSSGNSSYGATLMPSDFTYATVDDGNATHFVPFGGINTCSADSDPLYAWTSVSLYGSPFALRDP